MVSFLKDARQGVVPCVDQLFFKLWVYGKSGVGKTWALAQAEDPDAPGSMLIILLERNGEQSIRHANPNARYLLIDTSYQGPADEATQEAKYKAAINAIARVNEVIVAAQTGELQKAGITRIGIDSLTAFQALIKRAIGLKRDDDEFSPKDWGTLNEKWSGFLSTLRDLPIDVVCTGLVDTESVEDGTDARVIFCKPSLQGRAMGGAASMQFFNCVAYLYMPLATGAAPRSVQRGARAVGDEEATTKRTFLLEGDGRFDTKTQYPLTGVIREPIWKWFRALRSGTAIGKAATPSDAAEATASAAAAAAEKEAAKQPEPTESKPDDRTPRRRRQRGEATAAAEPGTHTASGPAPDNTAGPAVEETKAAEPAAAASDTKEGA